MFYLRYLILGANQKDLHLSQYIYEDKLQKQTYFYRGSTNTVAGYVVLSNKKRNV